MIPTPEQLVVIEETRRILHGGGPFIALTLVAAYRNDTWNNPRLIRFAHATLIRETDVETDLTAALRGLSLLPLALRTVAAELDEKRQRPLVPITPTTHWQRWATDELSRVAERGGAFASLALTAAFREPEFPDHVGVTHASALDEKRPHASALALDRMPSTLRQIALQIDRQTQLHALRPS